ncbi:MAG: nitrate reductase, partial [Polyangiaceae bacterium]|nr:nitrate reductase [Polyangiaceae bacterium]
WPCPDESHPGTTRRYIPGDPFVPEGKESYFYGKKDGKATVFLTPYQDRSDQLDEEFEFVLNTGRIVEQWHTGTMTDRIAIIRKGTPRGHFEMHRFDATRLGLSSNQKVKVTSRYGTLEGRVKVTESPRVGTVFACFYDDQFMINQLVTDKRDPFSKQPDFKTTAVRVEAIS